jgi:hypothetical protein
MFGPLVLSCIQGVRQVPGDRVSSEPSKRHDHRLSVCYGTYGTACRGGSLLRSSFCSLLGVSYFSFPYTFILSHSDTESRLFMGQSQNYFHAPSPAPLSTTVSATFSTA